MAKTKMGTAIFKTTERFRGSGMPGKRAAMRAEVRSGTESGEVNLMFVYVTVASTSTEAKHSYKNYQRAPFGENQS